MAKVTSKAPGKFAVKGGGKGGMQNFKAVGTQKPGVTEVAGSGGGKSFAAKIPTGGTGKIGGKQVGVKAVKPGQTGVR
jgi:hypothetical protein